MQEILGGMRGNSGRHANYEGVSNTDGFGHTSPVSTAMVWTRTKALILVHVLASC
jgi:hypothetical protein